MKHGTVGRRVELPVAAAADWWKSLPVPEGWHIWI
jgi:hypothetical protein